MKTKKALVKKVKMDAEAMMQTNRALAYEPDQDQLSRQQANIEILLRLTQLVAEQPSIRFGQLLINHGLALDGGLFFYESTELLKIMTEAMAYYNK